MGDASPVASPAGEKPDGEVLQLGASMNNLEDVEHIGNTVLIRAGTDVAIGTIADFKGNTAKKITIAAQCGDITATASSKEFVFACPDGVYIIGNDNQAQLVQPTATPQTAAVKTSDGAIITGTTQNNQLTIYAGGQEQAVTAEDTTDQMVAVPSATGHDVVYRINRKYTLIQNVLYAEAKMGAVLRVGLGVGQITGADNGMALTADSIGKQFGVYLTEDVIRLHQTTPTAGQSPWDVAWDTTRKLAWVATTSDNTIRGYSISAGTGVEQDSYTLVPDAQNIEVLENGTIVAASATGGGLQILTVN